MISDLTTTGSCGTIVPQDMAAGSLPVDLNMAAGSLPVQPVKDVADYLATRQPQPEIHGEERLLITLPSKLQAEVRALVRACKFVADLVRGKWSVQSACRQALTVFDKWRWNLNTFRQKFDAWASAKDWVVLVNLSKAPVSWRNRSVGLPHAFLKYCETKLARFARRDAKRQAILALHRHWRTGRDEDGVECAIPGYETGRRDELNESPTREGRVTRVPDWKTRDRNTVPPGWSYDNICAQIKKRHRFNPATRALLHEGESAAREHLPQNLGTRKGLRFLEKVTFDDVRMDWLVFNPATGCAEELWLLVARDEATALVLGFVMLPATVREDGKATHLGARQMKELAGYLLQTYPLPPYVVHWIVERGTATLAEGVKTALGELFNQRIKVHYTSMIGDRSPVGYAEKRKGNSRGKASHEAHNRLFHTQGSFIPGQTGSDWSIRPADLEARIKECRQIHEFSQQLPESRRDEVKYPLLTLSQARAKFQQLCLEQNFRRDHNLEGFDDVVEQWDGQAWVASNSLSPIGGEGQGEGASSKLRKRKEMPGERALRLIKSVNRWDRVSPDIVITFLAHNQRHEKIEFNGEIKYKEWTFRPASEVDWAPHAGKKLLCYHNADSPEFLHVTTGDGRIIGTWALRGRGAFLDQQALAESMRYTHAARETAKTIASDLAAPQRDQLAAMRAHNAALEQFVVTTDVPSAIGAENGSNVASAFQNLRAVADGEKAAQRAERELIKREGRAAAEDILASTDRRDELNESPTSSIPSAGDALLDALT